MSTFRSHPHELGERIDVADCINGDGVRLSVSDPEWSSPQNADGCTLLEPDDARMLGRLLFQAAARVDEARAYRDAKASPAWQGCTSGWAPCVWSGVGAAGTKDLQVTDSFDKALDAFVNNFAQWTEQSTEDVRTQLDAMERRMFGDPPDNDESPLHP